MPPVAPVVSQVRVQPVPVVNTPSPVAGQVQATPSSTPTPLAAAHAPGVQGGRSTGFKLRDIINKHGGVKNLPAKVSTNSQLRAPHENATNSLKEGEKGNNESKGSSWSEKLAANGDKIAMIGGAATAVGGLGTTVASVAAEGAKNAMNIQEMQNTLSHMQAKMGAAQQARAAELINTMQGVK